MDYIIVTKPDIDLLERITKLSLIYNGTPIVHDGVETGMNQYPDDIRRHAHTELKQIYRDRTNPFEARLLAAEALGISQSRLNSSRYAHEHPYKAAAILAGIVGATLGGTYYLVENYQSISELVNSVWEKF